MANTEIQLQNEGIFLSSGYSPQKGGFSGIRAKLSLCDVVFYLGCIFFLLFDCNFDLNLCFGSVDGWNFNFSFVVFWLVGDRTKSYGSMIEQKIEFLESLAGKVSFVFVVIFFCSLCCTYASFFHKNSVTSSAWHLRKSWNRCVITLGMRNRCCYWTGNIRKHVTPNLCVYPISSIVYYPGFLAAQQLFVS